AADQKACFRKSPPPEHPPHSRVNLIAQMYSRAIFLTSLLLALLMALSSSRAAEPAPNSLAQDARHILTQNCVKCHGGEKTKGEFDLTTREGLLHPGQEGPNVVPGNANASRLMRLIRHQDDPTMPAKA